MTIDDLRREMVVIYGDGIEAYVSLRGRAESFA